MLKDGVLYYADNRGQIIAPVNVGNFLSLPTLEILPGGEELLPQMDELSRAFQAAHLPVNMASVSLFRVSAAKGFEVFIENRNLVLCIAAEDWDANPASAEFGPFRSGPPRRVEDGTGSLGRRRQRLGCRT